MFIKMGDDSEDQVKKTKNSVEIPMDKSYDDFDKMLKMFENSFVNLGIGAKGKEMFEQISNNIKKVSQQSSRQNSMTEETVQEKENKSSPIFSVDSNVLSPQNGSQTERLPTVKSSPKIQEEKCLTERLLVRGDSDTSFTPELIEPKNEIKKEVEEKKMTI